MDTKFTWAGCSFTYVPASVMKNNDGFAVSCPQSGFAHRSTLKKGTGCKRLKTFAPDDPTAEANAIAALKAWLLAHHKCSDRVSHQEYRTSTAEIKKAAVADPSELRSAPMANDAALLKAEKTRPPKKDASGPSSKRRKAK